MSSEGWHGLSCQACLGPHKMPNRSDQTNKQERDRRLYFSHMPTKISPILQSWFLYSVNIYKYDIWNGYSSRFWHHFRSGNYWVINIWRLSSLQLGTALFSDSCRGIGADVLNYDSFSEGRDNSNVHVYSTQLKLWLIFSGFSRNDLWMKRIKHLFVDKNIRFIRHVWIWVWSIVELRFVNSIDSYKM